MQLRGANGEKKTLIQRSWEAAKRVKGVDRIIVSTDDDRIKNVANTFGAEVMMTSTSCLNGTERCAETCLKLKEQYDIVVNLQGDAPLTPYWFVEDLINELEKNPNAEVVTPVLRCDSDGHRMFIEDRKADRVGGNNSCFYHKKQSTVFFEGSYTIYGENI